MTNTELAILAHRAGFGEKIENSIRNDGDRATDQA